MLAMDNGNEAGTMERGPAHWDQICRNGERHERRVAAIEDQLRDECSWSIEEANRVCIAWIDDPHAVCVHVFRLACSAKLSDAELGRLIRETVVTPHLRIAAEHMAEKGE